MLGVSWGRASLSAGLHRPTLTAHRHRNDQHVARGRTTDTRTATAPAALVALQRVALATSRGEHRSARTPSVPRSATLSSPGHSGEPTENGGAAPTPVIPRLRHRPK